MVHTDITVIYTARLIVIRIIITKNESEKGDVSECETVGLLRVLPLSFER